MKRLKKIMALVIAMAMVVAMTLPAMATEPVTAPTSGSITINSPIVGAIYNVYKIFDMTTNAGVDAFSYTITEDSSISPFYDAVKAYAEAKNENDELINGLTLSKIAGTDPAVYNVSVDKDVFDAQKFGQAMREYVLNNNIAADYTKTCLVYDTDDNNENTSDYIKFDGIDEDEDGKNDGIPLGYYLINATYPQASPVEVKMGEGETYEQVFTVADLKTDNDGKIVEPWELKDVAKGRINTYATNVVTDDYVQDYIDAHGISTNPDGSPLNDTGKAAYKVELIDKMKEAAENQILTALENNASAADINVKEPILVFCDSSQPDAVINEKNEMDKWDIPVNPQPGVQPGQPDHGEPEGGKNIIVEEATETTPAYSADWSEAEIGESVHYQLRVNAMNFIRTGDTDDTIQQVKEYFLADYQSGHMKFDASKGLRVSVWQGNNDNDSQASNKVNVTKNADGTVAAQGYLDYTSYATGDNQVFFKNSTNQDANPAPTDIFGNGTGIMVPWVFVYDPSTVADDSTTEENESKVALDAKISQYPIYTITNVPVEGQYEIEEFKDGDPDTDGIQRIPVKKVDDNGNWIPDGNGGYENEPNQWVSVNNRIINDDKQVLDENNNPIQATKPFYTFSLYNSDVTIVVDYWMILKDDAVVDEPGNKNYAQYGWSPIDNKDDQNKPKEPTNPKDTDKPSEKEKVDEATVYTFAIAWVKVDEKGKELADAEFELPFYVKKTKDGNAYVYAGVEYQAAVDAINADQSLGETEKAEAIKALSGESGDYTNKVTTTAASAVITIKGVEQDTYTITETKAPAGYNKLTAPFTVEAKKSGPSVTTKTKTIIYLDRDGNVTDEVTTATTEYNTDTDSYNNASATDPEETSVPVYQFDPIVNKQGTELPSTGGIGTTIFYVVGAILVIGAGVILITRRKMDA